ncbi:flagellar protein [Pararhizobium antarcticum]|uniref:Flagellar protein n=1 Tax=Pararhizobium antarcticum TaxID=1798805 RepID=A0A657LW21_9HYPH|nr:flagellar protein [Pararhizobium antarcticum]OJF94279.1 flagellar protein [Rhizobium sp. 58]OJF96305.1 flagellar protein [Pararhizobium antarcticum]
MSLNDQDADEVVPQRKRGERLPTIDKALGAAGIVLAAIATFFPWYAFLHQDTFSMPAPWSGATRDLAEKVGSGTVASLSSDGKPESDPEIRTAVDELFTATVPMSAVDDTSASEKDGIDQPFPGSSGFKLMHVANGRALIEDASGMYLVRVGSVLPDNSRLATLEKREGSWVLITTNGDVFETN